MKAGRELDALIAEKVMGLAGVRDGKSWLYGDNWTYHKKGVLCLVPHYSTQIADAWLVVEKFFKFSLGSDGLIYLCKFADAPNKNWSLGTGDTAPLAICLAALKEVE